MGRRQARDQEGVFVLEGLNLLQEALDVGAPLEAIFVDLGWHPPTSGADDGAPDEAQALAETSAQRLAELLERCYQAGTRVFDLDEGVLARVAGTVTPQPVLAIVSMPRHHLADLEAPGSRLVVVCVDVRDPGNAGTVARSAWAAGADAVICCQGTVDPWNPKAVRASAGAVLHVPVMNVGGAVDVLAQLGNWGFRRLGTVARGGHDYAGVDMTGRTALVLGNEASGLDLNALSGHLDGLVSIPMAGGAQSLNVSMAATVLCFEAARQGRAAAGDSE